MRTSVPAPHRVTAGERLETARALLRSAFGKTKSLPLTTLGWAVLALALVGWGLAIRFGWDEFSLVATTMLVLLFIGIFFLFRRNSLGVELQATPQRTVVGGNALAAVTVTNRGQVRSLPQRVDVPVSDRVVSFDTPSLEAGGSFEQAFTIPTERRGVVTIGPVTVVRGDPLSLYRRDTASAKASRVWIHPRTARVGSPNRGWVQDLDTPTSDNNPRGDVAFHAIREYVSGDDLRHIHWRSTARTGKFMVRHYVDNRRPKFVLAIDLHRGAYASDAEFETVMEVAASVERRSFELGCPVVHHLGGRRVDAPHVSGLLDTLAEAKTEAGGSIADGVRGILAYDGDATIAILLTGSAADPTMMGRFGQQLTNRMTTVTVVATPTRSGMSGRGRTLRIEAPTLEDFAKQWRAAGVQ